MTKKKLRKNKSQLRNIIDAQIYQRIKSKETKKKLRKKRKDFRVQRDLLFYFKVQIETIHKNYFSMMKHVKNDAQADEAMFFLTFNLTTFITFSSKYFLDKYSVTLDADELNKFINAWDKITTEKYIPNYEKGLKHIQDTRRKILEIDYYQ